ncbi:U1 small nuclear ribonucleoprotein [Portunus trituberculatus]|uniref:U1 small nuclear ribonucleoprotein n=1 Tax=Portunus trituberculatus TaxID=210409 RepID=A0A5B7I1W1_PORTR|nr:U1 small nuclear ribonucleoprotein [Portunus trituberculatus]
MTQYLPPNLLALFAPRDPIPYLTPVDKLTWEKPTDGYSGVASFITRFEVRGQPWYVRGCLVVSASGLPPDPKDTPPPTRVETREERLERKRREKAEQMQYKLEQEIALWDPHNNEAATTDPYKSLFVSRINYDTSESKLRREFEIYGPIKKVCVCAFYYRVHNSLKLVYVFYHFYSMVKKVCVCMYVCFLCYLTVI